MNQPVPLPVAFALRLAGILTPLARVVAARFRVLGPDTGPLWRQITRAQARIASLMASLAAGRLRRRIRDCRGIPGGRSPRPHLPPRRYAWLLTALRHEAAVYRNQLERLLAEPATRDLLAAAPAALRTLRPLCHLLAIPLPPAPRRPRRPRTRQPDPAPASQAAPPPGPSTPPPLATPPPRPAPAPARRPDPFAWLTARNLRAHFLKPA